MGRDWRLLAGLVSVLCNRQKHKNNIKIRFVIYIVSAADKLGMCTKCFLQQDPSQFIQFVTK